MDAYQGATYQRLVNRMFQDQISVSREVYVDEMLVKSKKEDDHLYHLKQTFEVMRAYGIKLNPTKCTFGVRGGKFLEYMVSERGIEANPEKIEAIIQLQSPRTLKEVQKLTAVSEEAVSSVLVREEEKIQNPIYYVSKMLKGQKNDTQIEKLALALEKVGGWLLHVDGSSNANNGGAGILLQGPNEVEIEIAARLSFAATNNEAEYEALNLCLQLAHDAGARELDICADSQLVAMQQIPRSENERADALSKSGAMVSGIRDRRVTIMVKERPAIGEVEEVQVVEKGGL
ncbi:UNVERIFIED_CONTAM: Retrovirus-related Pol polyprotein from transposon gypsy [Sesamum latifolium]|uniref:Retrovirus-related Pol polyprotein from transposon gypsy n=1 Tax=Sesamum latifolium TaxID=2727402 RepID=A0AAW2U4A1_9LAMI